MARIPPPKGSPTPPFHLVHVSIDGTPFRGSAFIQDGETWNGWLMPYFSWQQADKLVQRVEAAGGKAEYSPSTDSFVFFGTGSIQGESESFPSEEIYVDGVVIRAYPIGAGCWCWEKGDGHCAYCQGPVEISAVSDATGDAIFCSPSCLYEALICQTPGDELTKILAEIPGDLGDYRLLCPHCNKEYLSVTDRSGCEGVFYVPDPNGFRFSIMTCPHCGKPSIIIEPDTPIKLTIYDTPALQKILFQGTFLSEVAVDTYINENYPHIDADRVAINDQILLGWDEWEGPVKKGLFCLDTGGSSTYPGFNARDTWNGWECPLFTYPIAKRILEEKVKDDRLAGIESRYEYSPKGGKWGFRYVSPDGVEEWGPQQITCKGQVYTVYAIGDSSWCWIRGEGVRG